MLGNLPQQCGKALGAYPTGDSDCPYPFGQLRGTALQQHWRGLSEKLRRHLPGGLCDCTGLCNFLSLCLVAPATIVWNYVGELIFNMLVLVGAIKMSDRLIRELMGLG